MNPKLRLWFVAAVGWLLAAAGNAQDPVFSQFFSAPTHTNAAFTGTTFTPRIALNYRNQWLGFQNAYTTYAVAYDQYFSDLNSGFGVSVLADVAGNGIYRTTNIGGSYAYNFEVGKGAYLKGGLEANLVQTNLAWDKLVFLDQIDPVTGAVDVFGVPNPTQEAQPYNTSRMYADIGAGLLLYDQHGYAGVSMKHINTPNQGLFETQAQVPIRLTFHAGADFKLSHRHARYRDVAFVSPNILYIKQGDFGQLNAGAYLSVNNLFGGLWYRHAQSNGDAVILLGGFKYKFLKVGYSYDATISGLSGKTDGSHEVSVLVNMDNDPRLRRRYRAKGQLDCFRMFK